MREGKVSSMRFSEKLNEWMELADCTAKELSEACGLSAATLSRFRSGERTPDQEGLNLLLQGLCTIAACKGKQLSPDSLYAQCTDCMDLQRSDPEALRTKINRLLTVLHISSAELAKAISYDPSFLSRIRSGQRAPADPKRFATDAGFMVCNEALQLHGGYGYIREYPLERLMRDARVHQILEGTNEIMRVIIARRMLEGDAPEVIR